MFFIMTNLLWWNIYFHSCKVHNMSFLVYKQSLGIIFITNYKWLILEFLLNRI